MNHRVFAALFVFVKTAVETEVSEWKHSRHAVQYGVSMGFQGYVPIFYLYP
jgi:hypothetical protein